MNNILAVSSVDLCLRNSQEWDEILWPDGEQEGQKELSKGDIAPCLLFKVQQKLGARVCFLWTAASIRRSINNHAELFSYSVVVKICF